MQTRRQFLKTGLGVLTSAYISGCSKKPLDVILVTMDTVGKRHLGTYGYEHNTSPNLDRLSYGATIFENCYSTGNQTMPSHASILTGQYPHTHGTIHQEAMKPAFTIAEALRRNGYDTTAITSVDFMNKNTIGQGFNRFFSPKTGERKSKSTLNIAKQYLSVKKDNPFFLWIHLWDAHHPYTAPEGFERLSRKERDEIEEVSNLFPRFFKGETERDEVDIGKTLTPKEQKTFVAQYDREISYMDAQIGNFIAYLKQRGIYDRSMMVFTADHGESMFENSDTPQTHNLVDQPVVQIPLIIKHPDYKAKRVKGIVQNIDIAPTIASGVGVEMEGCEGNDLFTGARRDLAYLSQTGNRVFSVVTDGRKVKKTVFPNNNKIDIPKEWGIELPRIEFISGNLENLRHDILNGGFDAMWKHPANKDEVVRYVRQGVDTKSVDFQVFNNGDYGAYKELYQSERVWSSVTGNNGQMPYRVVGLNSSGKVVASSEVRFCSAVDSVGKECFDLIKDPDETRNLYCDWGDLEAKLDCFAEKSKDLVDVGSSVDEETKEQLEAMGYV